MRALIVLALAACAAASDKYMFHGKYSGACDQDGIYYRQVFLLLLFFSLSLRVSKPLSLSLRVSNASHAALKS